MTKGSFLGLKGKYKEEPVETLGNDGYIHNFYGSIGFMHVDIWKH